MLKERSLLLLLLSLALAVCLVGCSSSYKATADKTTTTKQSEKITTENTKTDLSQQSDKGADNESATVMKNETQPGQRAGSRLMGQITSVKDRSVTLALFDMPSPPADGNPPAGDKPGRQTPELSGEKKTITIPASVKILSGGRNSSSEVSISDLKAGQMMEVRLNASTGAVESVRIMEAGQGAPPARDTAPNSSTADQ